MAIPACPTDCTTINLPTVAANGCAELISFGQVRNIYFSNAPLPDWNDTATYPTLADWVTNGWCPRVDNTSVAAVGDTWIRCLCVTGDLPQADKPEIRRCDGSKVYPAPTRLINFRVEDTGDLNYEMLRTLACNTQYYIAFEDENYIYYSGDSSEGGVFTAISMDQIIPESYQEMQTFNATLSWEDKFPSERVAKPTC